MKDHIACAQQLALAECPAQEMDRFLPDRRIECPQIDKIRGMQNDWFESTTLCCRSEGGAILLRNGRGAPAGRVAGKDLNSLTADLLRDFCCLDHLRMGGHMTTNTHYSWSS